MWEAVLESLIDSLKMLPILLVAYILIEYVEMLINTRKIKEHKWWSPIAGAGLGLVPQCGFSVVAADMFGKRQITLGVLFAVFIATSDEAIPVMLSHPEKISALLPLLLIKFIFAITVGLFVNCIIKTGKAKSQTVGAFVNTNAELSPNDTSDASNSTDKKQAELNFKNSQVTLKSGRGRGSFKKPQANKESSSGGHHVGCCGHHLGCDTQSGHAQNKWKKYLLHPLIHTAKIFAFILAINLIFGIILYFVGEEALADFLGKSYYLSPLIAVLIGLIPNCASSVVITELYIIGGIPFGACLAGLCVNAGLGFIILFKQNKNLKQNFTILATMVLLSIAVGYATLPLTGVWGL